MTEPQWMKEGRWPTPEEWIDYYNALHEESKLRLAKIVLDSMKEASDCYAMDHKGELEFLKEHNENQHQKIQLGAWLIAEARHRAVEYHAKLLMVGHAPN